MREPRLSLDPLTELSSISPEFRSRPSLLRRVSRPDTGTLSSCTLIPVNILKNSIFVNLHYKNVIRCIWRKNHRTNCNEFFTETSESDEFFSTWNRHRKISNSHSLCNLDKSPHIINGDEWTSRIVHREMICQERKWAEMSCNFRQLWK